MVKPEIAQAAEAFETPPPRTGVNKQIAESRNPNFGTLAKIKQTFRVLGCQRIVSKHEVRCGKASHLNGERAR